MKISTRLVAGFGLLIILLTLCTGTALRAFHHAREGMDDTVNIKMKKYQLAQAMFGEKQGHRHCGQEHYPVQ